MRVLLASLAVFLIASCASSQKDAGHSISRKSFTIAGGESIALPFNSEGPIDAENAQFKVEDAGFSVGRSQSEAGSAVLIWKFSFINKEGVELESVTVEEVALTGTQLNLVNDEAPTANNGVWRGNSKDVSPSQQTTPWLYERGSSTFIYRFSIKPKDAPTVVLYQPALFPDHAKAMFRKFLKQ